MTPDLIALLIVMFAAVGVVGWLAARRAGSERLPAEQGPGSERIAASDVLAGSVSDDPLEIRPLGRAALHKFSEEWASVQAMFVEDPSGAVAQADGLIADVMRARGYPVWDFEHRAAEVSAEHGDVVEHYRDAHAIATASRYDEGEADSEALQRAFAHYRALFSELLEPPGRRRTERLVPRTRRAS